MKPPVLWVVEYQDGSFPWTPLAAWALHTRRAALEELRRMRAHAPAWKYRVVPYVRRDER